MCKKYHEITTFSIISLVYFIVYFDIRANFSSIQTQQNPIIITTSWLVVCMNLLILVIGLTRWPTEQVDHQKRYVNIYTKVMACISSFMLLVTSVFLVPMLTWNVYESLLFLCQLYLLRILQRFFNGKKLFGSKVKKNVENKIRMKKRRSESIRSNSSSTNNNSRLSDNKRLPDIYTLPEADMEIHTANF